MHDIPVTLMRIKQLTACIISQLEDLKNSCHNDMEDQVYLIRFIGFLHRIKEEIEFFMSIDTINVLYNFYDNE